MFFPFASLRASSLSSSVLAAFCRRAVAFALACLGLATTVHAGNSLRGGALAGRGSSSAASSTSQSATSATDTTTQQVQTSTLVQNASAAYSHSIQALQQMQKAQAIAHTNAVGGANNLGADPNNPGQTLPNVPDGLAPGGLVPGVQGVDSSDPSTAATNVPVTRNANGTSSVTLAQQSGITLPPNLSSPATITASGTGVVGTITSGGVITPLTGGVATTVPPGGTISITQSGGSTVTFAGASASLPTAFATYAYTSATAASPIIGSWSGISGLTQSTYTPGGTAPQQKTVTITQTQQQALLTWQSFNIGQNTTLDFDQSAGGANVSQWVAINQIEDPSIHPSQILGSIQAPGQVYVINQNGIIFGGSSQVNIGALTASTLQLNPAYISDGLLNNAQNSYQFQFSSLVDTISETSGPKNHRVTSTTVMPLWTAPPTSTKTVTINSQTISSLPTGDITVQPGAQLNALVTGQSQGGRIALIAPNVTNDGTISTPDGQTILAAGLQVELTAHNSNDASLRGLDVYVGQTAGSSQTLPTGEFTFDGLPGNGSLTFTGDAGSSVGSYTDSAGTFQIMANTPVEIPLGSSVDITAGNSPSFAALNGGVVTNAAATLDTQGNVITPAGIINAPEGSVMVVGSSVNQLGIIDSTTSVTLNGRIDLLADTGAEAGSTTGTSPMNPLDSGVVTLGESSVTEIVPDSSTTDTNIGAQLPASESAQPNSTLELPISSLINIQGQEIDMEANSVIYAPSANVPYPTTPSYPVSTTTSPTAYDLSGAALTAGVTLNAGSWVPTSTGSNFQFSKFSSTTGDITLAQGATIDVSGSQDVAASVAENIVAVQLRGPQLADSPLQQNGALRGATVYVDIRNTGIDDGTPWIGTPVGDASGYAGEIQRTADEMTVGGGTVALNAGNSVTLSAGSTINVSGGWINYSGATVQTTKVVSNGQILDISQASPDQIYEGIYSGYTSTSEKWGISQTFSNGLLTGQQYDPGYIQGGNGGAISITSPSITLGGNLYGNTVAGTYQRTPMASLDSTYAGASFLPTTLANSGVPTAAQLTLAFAQLSNGGDVLTTTSPNITFQTDAYISQHAPDANELLLSQDIINTDGFGNLNINTSASGEIFVPSDVALTTVPGGSLTFSAASFDVEGSITAPGGSLTFKADDVAPSSGSGGSTPVPDLTRGSITLGPDGSLSTAGLTVDDSITSGSPDTLPFYTAGGSIKLQALQINLEPDSIVNVSGGVAVNGAGTVTYGKAGSISILAGKDTQVTSLVTDGELTLGSTLEGYSGLVAGGGTLTIQAPLVQIGGATLLNGDSSGGTTYQGETGVSGNGNTLWLDQGNPSVSGDFFSQGGFSSFNVEGIGQIETDPTLSTPGSPVYLFNGNGDPIISPAVLIAGGTIIEPVVQSYIAEQNGASFQLTPLTQAQEQSFVTSQRSSLNLAFTAEGVTSSNSLDAPPEPDGGSFQNGSGSGGGLLVRGDIEMQEGAIIRTDPQTNSSHGVSLTAANGMVAVLGKIFAPGGTISIQGGNTSALTSNKLLIYESSPNVPFPTVDLGPDSVLSTAGAVEQSYTQGVLTGTVLNGGNITIGGNIVGEEGAVLDVSGISAVVNELPSSLGQLNEQVGAPLAVPTVVSSNGGSIALNGTQMLYSDATLVGRAGSSTAQGGSLTVSSGSNLSGNNPATTLDINLIVSQQGLDNGFALPSGYAEGLNLFEGQAISTEASGIGATINNGAGGNPVFSYFAANPNLFVTQATDSSLSDNHGVGGGFTTLNLPGTLDFDGNVTITLAKSLTLATSSGTSTSGTGGLIYTNGSTVLSAPYVALNSFVTSNTGDAVTSYPAATSGSGVLTINAGVLADVGNLSLQNISTLDFNYSGGAPGSAGDVRGIGTLQVAGTINLNAAQVYPPTDMMFTIQADTINVTSPAGQTPPSVPLSAGGVLDLYANVIDQGGVLRAPLGVINLGTSATQQITFEAGSTTSVSELGEKIPYGIVSQSGSWYSPQGTDITLTGPPAKNIAVNGQTIDINSGATIDLTGGGDLLAYQFTPGTGGNIDILASDPTLLTSNSYAIVPGYSSSYAYAPYGAYAQSNNLQTNNVADVGYFNANLAMGEQVYLSGGGGLAAGTYTLMPARYALLPGAYLIKPGSGATPGSALSLPDGSSLVSGYLTSGFASSSTPLYSTFQIYSQATVLQDAPYTISDASTYFPLSAANHNVSLPRLPADAGQLVLDASLAMSIQGTLLSQAAANGLGGEVDISSAEDIYLVGPNTTDVPSDALSLNSSQLTDFGAASLLIGGYRTTTDSGTSVTVTSGNVVIDNSGATTTLSLDGSPVTVGGLGASDIILAANSTIDIKNGSDLTQFGTLSGGAQPLTVEGDGNLLRVSSDATAQITRSVPQGNVDTTSLLTIDPGVTIQNATGGAVGSLILDSSGQVSIDSSSNAPVLLSHALTLDSSLINLELGTPATAPTGGSIITQPLLQSLLSSTESLSLLSYSSIALYGGQDSSSSSIGTVTTDASGNKSYSLAQLALHADDIYYADTQASGGITINAQTVNLDNLPGGTTLPTLTNLGQSTLTIQAQTLQLGSGALRMDQFSQVTLDADSAILLRGLGAKASGSDSTPIPGSLTVGAGSLNLTSPVITSAASPDQSVSSITTSTIDEALTAEGALTVAVPAGDNASLPQSGQLGASLALTGAAVSISGGNIVLHSGSIALQANGAANPAASPDVTVDGDLDVSGVSPSFYGLQKYTDGGQVTLTSLNGNVVMGTGGSINVSAASGAGTVDSGAGTGGTLTVAAAGLFTPGAITGQGSTVTLANGTTIQGAGGTFSLAVGSLDPTGAGLGSTSSLEASLSGFSFQSIRDHADTMVTVDQSIDASSFSLFADKGSINVTSTIDASNVAALDANGNLIAIGGSIDLEAGGSVNLSSTAELNASGLNFNNADQGGSITLAAGAYEGASPSTSTASIQVDPMAKIVLGVNGGNGGTLLLRAPQVSSAAYDPTAASYAPVSVNASNGGNPTDVAIAPISSQVIRGASSIVVDGNYVQDALIADNPSKLELNTSGSQINLTSPGSVTLADGTPGNDSLTVSSSCSVVAGGVTTTYAAGNTFTNLAPGSVITLSSPGSVTFTSGSGGAIPMQLGTPSTYALNSSGSQLAFGSGVNLTLATGTPGNDALVVSSGGTIISAGTSTTFTAGSSLTNLAAGSTIELNGPGTVTLVGGSGGSVVIGAPSLIDSFESTAETNATAFMAGAETIQSRIFGSGVANVRIEPGEEIDNSLGSLELQNTWDLSTVRNGPTNSVPGLLTIRAAGNVNIAFGASLSDGFDSTGGFSYTNPLLPVGSESWSYAITAGADFGAANPGQVQTASQLATSASGLPGSLQIGYQQVPNAANQLTDSSLNNPSAFFQTIRTGSGNIMLDAGGDILLLNDLATIYTAGSQVDPTLGGAFSAPAGLGELGQALPANYSSGGGNVVIAAQGSIEHEAYSVNGNSFTLIPDSSAELPTSWLDREGNSNAGLPTTWWVDFTNFFEGVGALGGGNVTLTAGNSIVNVDAAIPTNARYVGGESNELGGGDLTVRAGNNIDGGVYYVESGQGSLLAGNDIQTNPTRAAVEIGQPFTNLDEMPTTLFLGAGSFNVQANGSLLLGPVANPFLLPQSYNNILSTSDTTAELSYFSTYGANDAVNVSSTAGLVTVQDFADGNQQGSLLAWYNSILDTPVDGNGLGTYLSAAEPWLELAEAANNTNIATDFGVPLSFPTGSPANSYGGVSSLLPPTLRVTAFSNDIDLVGSLTLAPSPLGTVDFVAEGSINAFTTNEFSASGQFLSGSGLINLSDTNPDNLPSAADPFTSATQYITLDLDFTATAATQGILDRAKQDLHAVIDGQTLHASDTAPVYIYAGTGDVSGLTLFSSKQAQVIAAQDLTDIGLYIQNNNATDVSLVEAGRDIIAYDASSSLRQQAGVNLIGYDPDFDQVGVGTGAPNSGDIQISGPGTLEVLAGRNLILGNDTGDGNPNVPITADGLFTGLTSVGGELNPYLPFDGANIVSVAGIGGGAGLASGSLDFTNSQGTGFTDLFLNPSSAQSSRYLPDLATLMGLPSTETNQQVWTAFGLLSQEAQDDLALKIFEFVLRDAGRDHNSPTPNEPVNYETGYAAIAALFPTTSVLTAPASGANFTSGDTVTIGTKVFTFTNTLTGVPNQILIGASQSDSLANLAGALTGATTQGQGPGSTYSSGTVADSQVVAALSGNQLTVTPSASGSNSTAIATSTTALGAAWSVPSIFLDQGNIDLTSREIKTASDGDITLAIPGGGLTVGVNGSGAAVDQGILTVEGGDISIFANNDVSLGTSRIFTLHGGNEIIWSTLGNIAAGASSKTVVSAPPTRVIVDPTSGSVATDLAGLATGGGIGVLETVPGAPPGNVDLIAPVGTVDAGDAGIRASGNISIAAQHVANASNITAGGSTSGVPATASVNIGALAAASSAAGSSEAAANGTSPGGNHQNVADNGNSLPSIITVEVIGYGGGDQD